MKHISSHSLALGLTAVLASVAILTSCGDGEVEPLDDGDFNQFKLDADRVEEMVEFCNAQPEACPKNNNPVPGPSSDSQGGIGTCTGGWGACIAGTKTCTSDATLTEPCSVGSSNSGGGNSSSTAGPAVPPSSSSGGSSSSVGVTGTLTCQGLPQTGTAGTAITQPTVRCDAAAATNPTFTGAPNWTNPTAGSYTVSASATCGGSAKTAACGTLVVTPAGSGTACTPTSDKNLAQSSETWEPVTGCIKFKCTDTAGWGNSRSVQCRINPPGTNGCDISGSAVNIEVNGTTIIPLSLTDCYNSTSKSIGITCDGTSEAIVSVPNGKTVHCKPN